MFIFERASKRMVEFFKNSGIKLYVKMEVKKACKRLRLSPELSQRFLDNFMLALDVTVKRMAQDKYKSLVEIVPESRRLIETLGEIFVKRESEVRNLRYVERALKFMEDGGNVLIVSNHTSIADSFVLDMLINRLYPNTQPAKRFINLAGHVLYTFPLHAALAGAVRCIQVFSSRYKHARSIGFTEAEVHEQNRRAHKKLAEMCLEGGECVILYPEGTRTRGGTLEQGDPKTAKITEIMADNSPKGLMILPIYVEGAAAIFPILEKGEQHKFLQFWTPNTCRVICGRPVPWRSLCPSKKEIKTFIEANPDVNLDDNASQKQLLHIKTMKLITELAPSKKLKGFWAK